jgi:C4-dicarboxylate-specific signal transduction histidine kinase
MEQQEAINQSSKMSALGEMASNIAHEINNPLNVINFRAQQLRTLAKKKDGEVDPAKIDENAANIEKNVGRITDIVKSLRAFARKGDQDPFQTVAVNFLLNEALELTGDRFKYRGVDVKIQKLPDEFKLECRPTQILQVLANLMNNAFDAIADLPERWVKLEVQDLGHAFELYVTDSGKGIPKEVAEKMFQQFYTTKPAGKGTGLGLSISKTILEAHRGMLKIDGECKNTRFVIGLPKKQADSYYKQVPQAA